MGALRAAGMALTDTPRSKFVLFCAVIMLCYAVTGWCHGFHHGSSARRWHGPYRRTALQICDLLWLSDGYTPSLPGCI